MYRVVRQRFYWKFQKIDVRLYLGVCHVCACTKPLTSLSDHPFQPRMPRQSWEINSIDLIGQYPYLGKGKSHILLTTKCFSSWTKAYHLGTAISKTKTNMLERDFFLRFGSPRVCLSFEGPHFIS